MNGGYADTTGTMSSLLLMLRLEGDLALSQATFGGIRTLLGGGEAR